ncbi:MAG: thiamine pyrophosphate-requiring protein [Pseudomonadales bacterium]|jgi:thiamine pyrophosphate-dependent acetolactate synthase large subunit-like protein|nr:thiamine pyrophosphate-requiring protein [Pseudomonadales bacterium]MDP7596237.1 thiamine pyrophosphate-requiring protein [Pseudomonadales bacterium]HJN49463.1 thiamine pyrophosphate-requiring protein [Pseudomonadales bacterium]
MNGFDLIANILKAEGVTWMACFPANPLIEAVAKVDIRPIVFRQERGGINCVDGFTRQTAGNQTGVFASQSGPGVENSFGGIAQAWGEAVPILFLPLGSGLRSYDVAPNFSATSNYKDITKLALSIDRVDRTTTQMQRAFHALKQGRPGPVVVEMHGDAVSQQVPDGLTAYRPSKAMRYAPSRSDVKDAVRELLSASNPIIWAGQGVLYAEAAEELKTLAELTQIPVVTTMQGKSAFPDDHPLALGSANRTAPKMVWKWLGESDLVFAVGSGLTRTGFGIAIPAGKRLIHATVSAEDINKDYSADIGMVGDAKLTLQMMIDEVKGEIGADGRDVNESLLDTIASTKSEWLAEWEPLLNSDETPINPYRVINEINKAVDHANTVMTHDAGNPRDQIMPFYKATNPYGYIGWGKTTHLGYGIPLVMGAKMADPDKFCMNLMGDLAFGHTGMEIETAVRAQIPITTIIINNRTMGGYDKSMPTAMDKYGAGNQSGDYAGVARALGARAINVDEMTAIGPAIVEAQAANKEGEVVVIEVNTRQETRFSQYYDLLK